MIYTLDGELHLQDVPTPLLHQLIQELTVPNPKFQNALRLGRPTYNIPETVMLYEIKGNALTLPRGMAEEVWRARPAGTTAQVRTLKGEPVDFDTSRFSPRSYQQQAVNAALACRWCQGVLIAPCGAGKTEIGMAVIAHLGRPALWITHTLDLAQQAKERAQLRLGLDEREVAIVSGSHKRCGTKLTIATVQSLYRMELNELARTVGVVIVDECHHVVNNPEQASMFAAVLRCLPARWRFGLTASDTRSDGLSETIFQVLGPRVAVIDSQQLEQLLITPRVETVPTTFVYTPRANESPIDYIRLMRHMADDAGRMQTVERIIDRAVTEGRSWLVLAASLTILDRLHTYVTYPSGHRDTLEVACRRAVLTGVNQTGAKLQEARMDEMGASFVEVTAHGGARPSHAVWQGRRYHRGGAVDYLGQHYEDFESATGYGTGAGLCGWNCRHTFFVVFPELGSPPAWTQESLEALNARDIEYDGRLYTRYEISQMQRARERAVRKWKRRYLAEDAAGADTTASAMKLRQARQSLADFTRATGGRVDSARTSVHGFGRSASSKASYAARKQERFNAANTELQQMREAGTIKAKGRLIESPSAPNEINFASDHVLQRWAERGMGPMDAERIIRSSKVAMSQRNGTQTCYYSELGFVAIGQDGNVSSIGPLDEGGKKLMEVVKKHGIPHS